MASDGVKVPADKGAAALTGTAGTRAERKAAAENALEEGAVREVSELSARYES